MEGPSKAEITFEDRKDGSCGVSYVVQEPGRFLLTVHQPYINVYVTRQLNAFFFAVYQLVKI